MNQTLLRDYPIDNTSILFLSLLRPHHSNAFRFSATLDKPVCPEALQEAVNRVCRRYPLVFAALRQDFFQYRQVPVEKPPVVREDPGMLLPMSREELARSAYRVFYRDNTVSVELFHALTDGYGAIATFSAMLVEYHHIIAGDTADASQRLDQVQPHELEEPYEKLTHFKPKRLPTRFSYLLPRPADADWNVRTSTLTMDIPVLLDAAHRYGVTLNTLLITILASTVMEMQYEQRKGKRMKPVRLMVPVNVRKVFQSRTLRNCSLYTLPTMEVSQRNQPFQALCDSFAAQMKDQVRLEVQGAMASANTRDQNSWYFRLMPWKLKAACLRFGYRFCGESNSSLTLTNLGIVKLPEELKNHVVDFQCWMIPRVTTPYGCTVLSFGDQLRLNMSRFCPTDELGERFFAAIRKITEE